MRGCVSSAVSQNGKPRIERERDLGEEGGRGGARGRERTDRESEQTGRERDERERERERVRPISRKVQPCLFGLQAKERGVWLCHFRVALFRHPFSLY